MSTLLPTLLPIHRRQLNDPIRESSGAHNNDSNHNVTHIPAEIDVEQIYYDLFPVAPFSPIFQTLDTHTQIMYDAYVHGFTPGFFNIAPIYLESGMYTLFGRRYRDYGPITYQEQFDRDAKLGGLIWGGYHVQFEDDEQDKAGIRDGAVGFTDSKSAEVSDKHKASIITHETRNLTEESSPRPQIEVSNDAASTSECGHTTNTEEEQQEASEARKSRCLQLLNRLQKNGTFAGAPGTFLRLPQGLVLTTIEILT
jgi:hypothetical protein